MKSTIKLIIITVFILGSFYGCFYDGIMISGNNEPAEEIRDSLPAFTEVSSSGSFNIYYTHGNEPNVKIYAESNLIDYIETRVFDDRLEIRFAQHVSVQHNLDIDIYVTSPTISKIQLSGSGKIEADSVSANSLELDLSGSGKILSNFYGSSFTSSISGSGTMNIKADCDTAETNISGSGHINLEAYGCKMTKIAISGSGKAELTGSSEKVKFDIIGSGKISAYEFPVKEADVMISGAGDVYVNVSELLDALLTGSGDLHYIGTPLIHFSTTGSGELIEEN
jgi:hypothetical protein